MLRYRVVPPKDSNRNLTTYGLLAEESVGVEWSAVAIVPDVSCDYELVSRLADRCTHGQLAPYQMLDVVMDTLLL